ncbi:hypothetical protein LKL35_17575 [Streptomyces sp. ET3-23]|uniref:hypothetical protein n=1 Tax=Streptomyces sp. ET3-23 TaxID=2885643 RepID=UPI001D118B0A|nr:hypothetical protein [Streptomyces sp. ET3-23]MCC2277214.1 hypothetical protein [Streptomyces sp. ET3-23]
MAVFGALSALAKGMPLEVLLPLYSAAVLSFVFGFLGRGRQLQERLARIDRGERLEGGLFAVVRAQLLVSVFALLGIAIWFASVTL